MLRHMLPSSSIQSRNTGRTSFWVSCSTLLLLMSAPAYCIQLSVPSSVPDDASAVLDQSFLSFAIEGRDFIDYSGAFPQSPSGGRAGN